MPLGIAHEAATPSCSRRRSQCSRVALCSWTTKRPPGSPPGSPAGSLVVAKSRFARYSPSLSVVRFFVVGVTVFGALRVVLFLLGEPVERRGVLGVLGLFDQQVLGLLEALCLAAACLIDRLPRGV